MNNIQETITIKDRLKEIRSKLSNNINDEINIEKKLYYIYSLEITYMYISNLILNIYHFILKIFLSIFNKKNIKLFNDNFDNIFFTLYNNHKQHIKILVALFLSNEKKLSNNFSSYINLFLIFGYYCLILYIFFKYYKFIFAFTCLYFMNKMFLMYKNNE